MVPDSSDIDKRLAALEQQVAAANATNRLGLVVSVAFLGFTLYQYFTRPEPITVEILD